VHVKGMISFVFAFILCTAVVGQDAEMVKEIDFAAGLGGLQFRPSLIPGALPRPSGIGFDKSGRLYLVAGQNGTINIYDDNVNLERFVEIRDSPAIDWSYYIHVLANGSIVGVSISSIQCVGEDGRGAYLVVPERSGLSSNFAPDRVWSTDNYTFFYRDGVDPVIIDATGNIVAGNAKRSLIKTWRESGTIYRDSKNKGSIDSFLESNGLILVGDRIYSEDFRIVSDFWRLARSQLDRSWEGAPLDLATYPNPVEYRSSGVPFLLTFDAHDNYYFLVRNSGVLELFIVDKYGSILTSFPWRNIVKTIAYGIAPSGDIYTYTTDFENRRFRFYRIRNTWDPISREEVLAAAGIDGTKTPKLTSLTASSTLTEPFDLNAYHPVKVLDGKLDSAWMEAAEGPGIGEWWQMKLDRPVTVDEIRIGPGYLGEPWWRQNNRIRQIDLVMDDESTIRYFADAMEMQSIKLSSPETFQTLKIVIEEIYPTTNWDDTPIAEVELWYEGEQIEPDISEFADHLEVDAGS